MKLIVASSVTVVDAPANLIKFIKKSLTITNPDWFAAQKYSRFTPKNVPQFLHYFEESGANIIVPRGYDFSSIPDKLRDCFQGAEVLDERMSSPAIFPDSDILLTDLQNKAITKFGKSLSQRTSGVYLFALPVSTGKTILGLFLSKKAGERTLILCKSSMIADAWLDDLQKTFPGIVPGFIKQTEWSIGNEFTVASWQTINRREKLWEILSESHGCLIIDEVHKMSAPVMKKFAHAFAGRIKIGLTGTVGGGAKKKLLYAELGKPFMRVKSPKEETETSLPVSDVEIVKTNFTYRSVKIKKSGEEITVPFRYSDCIRAASRDLERNALILEKIKQEYLKNNICLVLTPFREHAAFLERLIHNNGISTALFLGGDRSTEEKERKYQANISKVLKGEIGVVVATTGYIAEGANIPPLNRLFLTISMRGGKYGELLEQAIGRIRRKSPSTGKTDAVVFDFVDCRVRPLHRQFQKYRFRIYKNKFAVKKFKFISFM